MKLQYVATCLFGLEKTLGEELDGIGARRTETMDGRVFFEGDSHTLARANLSLRCAERVFLLLGRFPADSFDGLFEGTKALPWEDWIGRNDAFPVKGHAIKKPVEPAESVFSMEIQVRAYTQADLPALIRIWKKSTKTVLRSPK